MEKFRIGNDIPLQWTITRGDEAEDLTRVPVKNLFIVSLHWELQLGFSIGGEGNNVITTTFPGASQQYCGPYWLRLEENPGAGGMNVIESKPIFELRPISDSSSITPTTTTELATDVLLPSQGLSAYQIAVIHGFQGTEEEWLAGIVGREGVNDYSLLSSKPKINSHELVGDKSSHDLDLASVNDVEDLQDQIDAIVNGNAVINLAASPSLVFVGVESEIALTATTDTEATAIAITRDGEPVASGTGTTLSATDTITPDEAGSTVYTAAYTIAGLPRSTTKSVDAVYPCLYGAGADYAAAVNEATVRRTPAGTYNINVATAASYVFFVVPATMSISSATMSGFNFPLQTPVDVEINGVAYKSYQSANTYDAGIITVVLH